MIMKPQEALDTTLKYFKIKAVDLSRNSGIDPYKISKYRRGHKDMGSVSVFRLLNALPTKAKLYFLHLYLFGEDTQGQTSP